MSISWCRAHADELGAILTRAGYRFPETLSPDTIGKFKNDHRVKRPITKEEREGVIAKQVFEALDSGKPTRQIVLDLQLDPARVRKLAEEWMKCGTFDAGPLAAVHNRKRNAELEATTPPEALPPQPAAPPPPSRKTKDTAAAVAEALAQAASTAGDEALVFEHVNGATTISSESEFNARTSKVREAVAEAARLREEVERGAPPQAVPPQAK